MLYYVVHDDSTGPSASTFRPASQHPLLASGAADHTGPLWRRGSLSFRHGGACAATQAILVRIPAGAVVSSGCRAACLLRRSFALAPRLLGRESLFAQLAKRRSNDPPHAASRPASKDRAGRRVGARPEALSTPVHEKVRPDDAPTAETNWTARTQGAWRDGTAMMFASPPGLELRWQRPLVAVKQMKLLDRGGATAAVDPPLALS
jgi:hypothetical protein